MWAAGAPRRQVPADAAASQFGKAGRPAFPLLPDDGPMPSSDPLVEVAQLRRGFAESEVAAPSDEIDRQLSDDLREALASITACQFPHPASEPDKRLRCNAPPRLFPIREADAQELTLVRASDRTLRLVDLEFETLGQESFYARHHPLAGSLAAHVNVAVIGMPSSRVPPVAFDISTRRTGC